MLKNYFKVAFRNLWKNKGFSFINITGLAIGMASAILILLWIQSEWSYDGFHEKKDRIYETWNRAVFSGKLHCWNTTPKVLASALQRDLPEVEHTVRVNWSSNLLFSVGEKRLTVVGNMVDSVFLQVFTFPLLRGDARTVLNDNHAIVITESLAKTLFGRGEAMGQIIKIDNKDNFTVTGILKDLPEDSRFNFRYLLPWSYMRKRGEDDVNWGNNSTRTYVLLKPGVSLAQVAPKVLHFKVKYQDEDKKWEMFLYPMDRWRLYSRFDGAAEDGGRIEFVRLFGIVAGFILLIACINFMNLSTARSEKRAKEVGIRKVVGAPRSTLIAQFIGESILLSLMAGVLALGIVLLSLPGFNQLTDKHLHVPFGSAGFWLAGLGFVVFTGLLAGSYPAFFLSSFQPVKVLKGTPGFRTTWSVAKQLHGSSFKAAHALITPRKVLVVIQFSFAIILIICTVIVKQQIDHARDREAGYDRDRLVYHYLTGDIPAKYELIRQELLSSGAATSVCRTNAALTNRTSDTWGFEWAGKDPNDKTDFVVFCADEGLVKTAGLQLVQGRDFDLRQYLTDSTALLLNESAVKAMHFKDPIGQLIKYSDVTWHVVGVFKDFILESPYSPINPMVVEGSKGWFNIINFKLNGDHSTADNLKRAEAIFKKYNPEYPFEYNFVDADYARKFQDEKRTGTLAGLFAGLTIFISCLGLFGLATYTAENRIKEIGVRKVLGAFVMGITALLSRDFLALVLVSFSIAAPVAWMAMYAWLKGYAYRVGIHWWVFLLAGIVSVLIALLTVSYQAVKAAIANPIRSLRSE
ncbi:MAG TPA: ABC transporter permease [Puia sp.]|jgi:ABC-type antimicrobial peptide transport system permease subunit